MNHYFLAGVQFAAKMCANQAEQLTILFEEIGS